jgi:hypothetical protein
MLSSAWNSNDQLTRFNTNLTKEVHLRGHMAEGKKGSVILPEQLYITYHF